MDQVRILLVSAHADDVELGCGGTVRRFVEEQHIMKHVCFSFHKNLYPQWDVRGEFHRAQQVLGEEENPIDVEEYDLEACWGEFQNRRQFIYDVLERLRDDFNPSIVFTHSGFDTNQDHVTVNAETIRVFKKHATIYGYEFPNNNLQFNYDLFVKLQERHVQKKMEALACYRSQADRPTHNYMQGSYIRSLAVVRGQQVMTEFAECFEAIRIVL
jgi:LmbE family N-acetylglucosaminyl deacetylase